MSYEFKIKLLIGPDVRSSVFESKDVALDHARKIAEEDDKVPTRLVVTRNSDHARVTCMRCPMHGIVDYLENFNGDIKSGVIPQDQRRRRGRGRSLA